VVIFIQRSSYIALFVFFLFSFSLFYLNILEITCYLLLKMLYIKDFLSKSLEGTKIIIIFAEILKKYGN